MDILLWFVRIWHDFDMCITSTHTHSRLTLNIAKLVLLLFLLLVLMIWVKFACSFLHNQISQLDCWSSLRSEWIDLKNSRHIRIDENPSGMILFPHRIYIEIEMKLIKLKGEITMRAEHEARHPFFLVYCKTNSHTFCTHRNGVCKSKQ